MPIYVPTAEAESTTLPNSRDAGVPGRRIRWAPVADRIEYELLRFRTRDREETTVYRALRAEN
jgi:hypothetical protein